MHIPISFASLFITFEYIKLKGKLIAIDSSHTKIIFKTTRFLVLLRPKRIGYFSDKYRSIEMVHRCIMLAVQNRTSKHIHTRQCTDCNGKYPKKKMQNLQLFSLLFLNLKNLKVLYKVSQMYDLFPVCQKLNHFFKNLMHMLIFAEQK